MKKISVLFVCLGNICRSPAAEGSFTSLVSQLGHLDKFHIDSSGTGDYHIGELPHATTRKVALENGIELIHRARQFHPDDFETFDFILTMDDNNHRDVLAMAKKPEHKQKVFKFRHFDPEHDGAPDVPDPYFGGLDGFKNVQKIVERTARGFWEHINKIHKF